MVHTRIDPNNKLGKQRFCDLDISTKYQNLTSITVLIPMSRFLDMVIDVDYRYPCTHIRTSPTLVATT